MNTTKFLAKHRLPLSYIDSASRYFDPLVQVIIERKHSKKKTLYLGINGCQGSGKTTLADYLCQAFIAQGLSACALSIDDFYLTIAERNQLAKSIHPLFVTRGVPATHDTLLAKEILQSLSQVGSVKLPQFDKSTDDRMPVDDWKTIVGPVDIVILEGWCVGIPPQSDDDLTQPINELEIKQDSQAVWRNYVNKRLSTDYKDLWSCLDSFLMLVAPSFDCVFNWRLEQEDKLRHCTKSHASNKVMSAEQIHHFIMHYERLTEHALSYLPERCDWTINLDNSRAITGFFTHR